VNTLEAIQTRRSVRAFTAEPVPEDLLRQVLQAGRAAPSGSNVQAWGFVLVRSPGQLDSLRALAPGMIGRPTAAIAICLDRQRAQGARLIAERLVWLDIGIAAENMWLAAHDLGLGACAIGSFHRQAVAAFLRLPEDVEPVLLLSLGYPQSQPRAPGRRPMAEVCFREEWGVPYE
jgi:nitroreductase